MLRCRGNVASVPKALCISYSRISYFGHACPKINIVLVLISRLTGKCATQNLKNLRNSSPILDMLTSYGHIKKQK